MTRRWNAPLLVAGLAALGLFASTVTFRFTYDDVPIIAQNALVHQIQNWPAILGARWWNDALYRPLTLLTFAVDWTMSGGSPAYFHAVNVLLHLANTVLVFALARGILGGRGAGVAALLFAVHPTHVEAVSNVVGRAELLATLGVLVAALSYRHEAQAADRGRRVMLWGLAIAGTVAGLASKESAFALPGLLLVLDWLDAMAAGESLAARLRRHWPLWVAVTATWSLWMLLWFAKAGGIAPTVAPGLAGLGLLARARAMLPVIPEYARLLLVPSHLSADYSPRYLVADPAMTARAAAGLFTLLAAGAAVWVGVRYRQFALSAGVVWAGLALSVVCNVAFPTEILLAERTMYLPSVGVVLAAGAMGDLALARFGRWAALAIGLLVALGCARVVTRTGVWRDNDALFASIVRDAPGSYRADWIAGMLAYQSGDRRMGRALLDRAASVDSTDVGLLTDMANRLEEDSHWAQAGRRYEAAYKQKPIATLYAARAIDDFVRARQLDRAAAVAARAWPADSAHIPLRIARSDLAEASGDFALATQLRLGVARQVPGAWQYWLLTAVVAERAGLCETLDESLSHLTSPDARSAAAEIVSRRRRVKCSR